WGVFVYILWAVEFAAVAAFCLLMARESAARPFCESCQQWADKEILTRVVRTPSVAAVEAVRKADKNTTLLDLPAPGPDAGGPFRGDEFHYKLTACPNCRGVATLSVSLHAIGPHASRKNETVKSVQNLHDRVVLAPSEVATVTALVEALPA